MLGMSILMRPIPFFFFHPQHLLSTMQLEPPPPGTTTAAAAAATTHLLPMGDIYPTRQMHQQQSTYLHTFPRRVRGEQEEDVAEAGVGGNNGITAALVGHSCSKYNVGSTSFGERRKTVTFLGEVETIGVAARGEEEVTTTEDGSNGLLPVIRSPSSEEEEYVESRV